MNYKIFKEISLQGVNRTGSTKHYIDSKEVEMPAKLQIVKYEDDSGFYLFYLDSNGEVLTDTYHDTLANAMQQALWEFNILEENWKDI